MKRSFWKTIRGKLVSRTMLVVLIPLLALGGAAIAAMTSITQSADERVAGTRAQLGEDVVGQGAAHNATMVAADLAVFLDERLRDVLAWSDAANIRGAARDGHEEARTLGLLRMSTVELDDLYSDGRELGVLGTGTVGVLATNLRNSPSFTRLNITDRNGFNVATATSLSSTPTGIEDFVQSDEEWWQNAWETGLFVSEPEFDEFSGSTKVYIAVRLDDLATPVGVLRATLDIGVVQELAGHSMSGMAGIADGDAMAGMADGDAMAGMADGDADSHQMTGFAGFDVTIVAASGMLLAETSSGSSSDRIMNPDVNIGTDANPRLSILAEPEEVRRADHPNMYSLTDDFVAGYAHVLDSFNDINQSNRVGPDDVGSLDWIVVAQQPAEVGFATLVPLEDLSNELRSTSSALTLLLIMVVVIGLIGALVSSWLFARRITDPIQTLRNAAVIAADETLPNVVAKIDELGPDEEIPTLEPVRISTGDEVEDLAHSFNTVQQTAADLAAEQARLRRKNVASTFVSLGRRNQNLLARQLEHINAMEHTETSADTLQRLFQLDHLATRMRRNAESLLVLAGEETPRRFQQPVPVRSIIQAAGGEIEEFDRLDLAVVEETLIEGVVASDVAHLLAEILENASRFSPPSSLIQVTGYRRENGYSISVIDQGLGMEPADLATANDRLANPVEFDRAPSAYLGLFVVGHLARRHNLTVRLSESPFGGVTAQIDLPHDIQVDPSDVEADSGSSTELATAEIDAALEPSTDDIAPTPVAFDADSGVLLDSLDSGLELQPQPDGPLPQTAPSGHDNGHHFDSGPSQPEPGLPITTSMAAPAQDQLLAPEQDGTGLGNDADEQTRWGRSLVTPVEAIAPGEQSAFASPVPAPDPEMPVVQQIAPPAVPNRDAPEAAEPEETLTTSGFRKRRRGQEGAPAMTSRAEQPGDRAEPAPRRDAQSVQASLARFRAGVEEGRAAGPGSDSTDQNQSDEGGRD